MAEPRWYVSVDGHQLEGDYSLERAKELVQENLGKRVLVWSQGMAQWAMPEDLPQFRVQIPRTLPEPAPPVAEKKDFNQFTPRPHQEKPGFQELQKRAGILKSLLDFRFQQLIGSKIIPIVYGIAMILIGLAAVGYFFLGGGGMILTGIRFQSMQPVLLGLLIMVATPLAAILYLTFVRLWCEIILTLFRIKEDLTVLVERRKEESEKRE